MKADNFPEEVCGGFNNVYDCLGTQEAVSLIVICAISTLITVMYIIYVMALRISRGISLSMVRRVNGYWLPKPIESFIVTALVANILRLIHYVLLVMDLPRSWLARCLSTAVVTVLDVFTVGLMLAGIVASIPPIFGQYKRHPSEKGTIQRDLLLRIPSAAAQFWLTLTFMFIVTVTTLVVWLLWGWVRDTGRADLRTLCLPLLSAPTGVALLVLFLPSSYYCYGFYRIIRHHAEQTVAQGHAHHPLKKAAENFRRIFTALWTIYTVTIVLTLLGMALNQFQSTYVSVALTTYGINYIGLHVIVELYLLYTIKKNTELSRRHEQYDLSQQYTSHARTEVATAWEVASPNYRHQLDTDRAVYSTKLPHQVSTRSINKQQAPNGMFLNSFSHTVQSNLAKHP